MTSSAIRPSCGRASFPSWVRATRPQCSSSSACRLFGVLSARRGAAARRARLCCRRCGRYARRQWERMSASPGMARAVLEAAFRIDVRPILPTISAPTLVIHARDEVMPVQCGRYLADHIPGARLLEVEGIDHAVFADPDRILTAIEEFLT